MRVFRRLLLLTVCLAAIVLVSVGARWMLHRNGDAFEAQEENPALRSASKPIVLSGYVDVEEGIISLYPVQPGRVERVLIRENQPVSKGAELLLLDNRLARLKLQEAKADLEAAAAKLEAARQLPALHKSKLAQQTEAVEAMQKKLSGARYKAKSAHKLFEQKLLSEEDYNAVLDQVKEVEAGERAEREKFASLKLLDPHLEVRQAEANVQAKKAQLDEARYALDEHTLRAPSDGIVLRVNVGPGDVLGPIPKDAAVLFGLNQQRIIRVSVEQEFASQVKVGYQAEIQDYIDPDAERYQGHVVRMADVFMHTRSLLPQKITLGGDDTRTLECIVALDAPADLRLGQRVRVTIRPR